MLAERVLHNGSSFAKAMEDEAELLHIAERMRSNASTVFAKATPCRVCQGKSGEMW